VLHISTKQEIALLRDHKDVASCKATPHHLTPAAPECYERLGTRAQMNPPVRDASLKRSETITNRWVASRAGWTPYDGKRVTGWPVGTFHTRAPRDEGGRVDHAIDRRAGAVSGNAESVRLNPSARVVPAHARREPGHRGERQSSDDDGGAYCFASVTENSPFRTRAGRPSTNFATASSP
jgi:hypothetical protein